MIEKVLIPPAESINLRCQATSVQVWIGSAHPANIYCLDVRCYEDDRYCWSGLCALAFWCGGLLITDREYSTLQLYVFFVSLTSCAQVAGSTFTFASDVSKATHASQELQHIMDLKATVINKTPPLNLPLSSMPAGNFKGKHVAKQVIAYRIEFECVSFTYPSRSNKLALADFSVTVGTGQTLALVGQS